MAYHDPAQTQQRVTHQAVLHPVLHVPQFLLSVSPSLPLQGRQTATDQPLQSRVAWSHRSDLPGLRRSMLQRLHMWCYAGLA